jgi:CheY-like chemotaxis protein
MLDSEETTADLDGDGRPDWRDPRSDAPTPAITLVHISTEFNQPVGIDFHEPSATVVMSVHYSSGSPYNFERVEADGTHVQFSTVAGLTDEVKIATARSGGVFPAGEFFVGNGTDGEITRISSDGLTVTNPWVSLSGDDNGLMRDTTRAMLEIAGHDVKEAESGVDGVKYYRASPADIVITDIVMPEMDGLETIQALIGINPAVKILAISGGGRMLDGKTYLSIAAKFGTKTVLNKPFFRQELLDTVDNILAS